MKALVVVPNASSPFLGQHLTLHGLVVLVLLTPLFLVVQAQTAISLQTIKIRRVKIIVGLVLAAYIQQDLMSDRSECGRQIILIRALEATKIIQTNTIRIILVVLAFEPRLARWFRYVEIFKVHVRIVIEHNFARFRVAEILFVEQVSVQLSVCGIIEIDQIGDGQIMLVQDAH
jgi:hypothetical protein